MSMITGQNIQPRPVPRGNYLMRNADDVRILRIRERNLLASVLRNREEP